MPKSATSGFARNNLHNSALRGEALRGVSMQDFFGPHRHPAIGEHGMAATSVPLATLTAVDVLRAGGNAVDAAIAACAVMCVAEPAMTRIGGGCLVPYSPEGGTPNPPNGPRPAPGAP